MESVEFPALEMIVGGLFNPSHGFMTIVASGTAATAAHLRIFAGTFISAP